MRIRLIMTIVVCVFILGLFGTVSYGLEQRRERLRLEMNQRTLLEQAKEYQVRDSMNASTVRTLVLKTDEFRRNFTELNSLVRDMGLRVRRVENISQAGIEGRYEVKTVVRDTLTRSDGDTCAVGGYAIRYKSPYIHLDGVVTDSVFLGSIITFDTLTQIVHRIPKRFLFIRYGTRELRQEIVSSNPNSRITYQRSIRLKR